MASKLLQAEEKVLQFKAAHDQAEASLVTVMNDLQTAILENQKLNSEKRIDHENMTSVVAENKELAQKLLDLQQRFSKFVQQSLTMTSREGELINMLENAEEKLFTQGAELEKHVQKVGCLQEENDALLKLSIGIDTLVYFRMGENG